MKNILLFNLVIALFFYGCSSSKTTVKNVSQKYYNTSFSPEVITNKTSGNIELTVTPVGAKSLNKETFEAALRDGNYEKEFVSVIETWKLNLKSQPKQQRLYTQGKINAFDCLTKLEKDGAIPPHLSYLLKSRIIDKTAGWDGSEVESLGDKDVFPEDYNPYKINATYFSVFKLTFENKGSAIEKVNISEFQIVSNEEQLYPLGTEYFEKNLNNRTETMKNSYRMNMPKELTITPGQRISKFIAVPAINTDNNKLQVQFIRNGNVANFNFTVLKKETEKNFTLEKYEFVGSGDADNTYNFFYVVNYKDNRPYALKDRELFVSNEMKNSPASTFAIGISPLGSDIVFGSATDFLFSTEKNNKKKIEFKSMKRDKKTGQYL